MNWDRDLAIFLFPLYFWSCELEKQKLKIERTKDLTVHCPTPKSLLEQSENITGKIFN